MEASAPEHPYFYDYAYDNKHEIDMTVEGRLQNNWLKILH